MTSTSRIRNSSRNPDMQRFPVLMGDKNVGREKFRSFYGFREPKNCIKLRKNADSNNNQSASQMVREFALFWWYVSII